MKINSPNSIQSLKYNRDEIIVQRFFLQSAAKLNMPIKQAVDSIKNYIKSFEC